ncbi:MAG: carbohydrate binding domain-containing protein [Clostridia bacterium]|nr:carbohydrate binding domain-containing protein [Clostridia bacterium]
MKHFRKVSAVLLSILMVAVMLPSFLSFESAPVEAAEAGVVTNGGFETGDASNWDPSAYGVTITNSSSYKRSGSYGCRLSKDGSHNGNNFLTQVVPVNTNAQYTFSFYVKSVKTDCDYVACFTYSLDLGDAAGSCNTSVVSNATVNPGGTSWKQITYTVNTGSNKYLKIRFIGTGVGSGDCGLDDIALTVVNAGDTGTHAKPSLTGFGTEKNRPSASSDNVIVQPGFESTTNAQWNTTDFLKQGVSVVTSGGTDGDAHSGSKFLKYYHGSVGYTDWPMFEFTCPTAGEYVFSAWVRTPTLSANNVGAASIGIIDRDTNKFLTYGNAGGSYDGHYSNPETQLRSTATDDNWHLRSVTFYVGANNSNVKIGMYGLKSTMYVDDISVHLLTKGVKYEGNQTGTLSASTSVTNKFCESDNNLIPDCNMNGDPSEEFWTIGASGWNNGFLEFNKDATSAAHGNALHFKGTSPASNKAYRYIKFVYVEPNTSYTVSFDYRVVKTGNPLMFVDNNIVKNATFHTPSLGSASNSWKTYSFTFNSGNYNRIGIVFKDGSGEAYFDDFRFFKTSDGIADEPAEELFPTLKHNADGVVRESRMEMDNGKLGLAFLFNLKVSGATRVEWSKDGDSSKFFNADFTNAKVDPFEDGGSYKLLKAGAVVTNKAEVGQDEKAFNLDNLNSNLVIDVPGTKTLKLFYTPEGDMIHYAVRVANIPESAMGTVIYMRPYYVFDYNGTEVTVYGDIVYDSYKKIPDINDGWLEWD